MEEIQKNKFENRNLFHTLESLEMLYKQCDESMEQICRSLGKKRNIKKSPSEIYSCERKQYVEFYYNFQIECENELKEALKMDGIWFASMLWTVIISKQINPIFQYGDKRQEENKWNISKKADYNRMDKVREKWENLLPERFQHSDQQQIEEKEHERFRQMRENLYENYIANKEEMEMWLDRCVDFLIEALEEREQKAKG